MSRDKEASNKYMREWRKKNQSHNREYMRKYRQTHKAYFKEKQQRNYRRWGIAWHKYFTDTRCKVPKCSLCQKTLVWPHPDNKERSKTVRFDHRNGRQTKIKNPANWIRRRACNETNQKRFEGENFGTLCNFCNRMLPTDTTKRKAWVCHLINYMNQ